MYRTEYERWKNYKLEDEDLRIELAEMAGSDDAINDAFYRNLEFGTGGLRGVIGAGTNRMNVYTVAKASQGIANYVIANFDEARRSIAVSYDSRIKSDVFAKVAAEVFAANGITVYIYSELMPTPCLSFAVRKLGCAMGVMITASHNPAKYNGYKVYGSDGCQITTEAADEILVCIEAVDIFSDVKRVVFDGALGDKISYIDESVFTDFTEEVKRLSLLGEEQIDKSIAIVYSPLNGTGLKPVLRVLDEIGYKNVSVVEEQRFPDGNFPTCPYPNPEIKEAMALGMEYAKRNNAELLLATDPDCDRVGIAVKDGDDYVLLSGNQVGCLLLDYICMRRNVLGKMPENPVMVKTIVTTDLGQQIANHYGVKTVNVLTGFKFIGEQIGLLEAAGRRDDYIFGFEESYGYLSGSHVRDKDAVNAASLICEMFAFYKGQGISLVDKLNSLYEEYGYCENTLLSFEFEGAAGVAKMQNVMGKFRSVSKNLCGFKVDSCIDYSHGIDGLPKSNVLKFYLENGSSVVVRPSGTEPKLKLYLSVSGDNKEAASELTEELSVALNDFVV